MLGNGEKRKKRNKNTYKGVEIEKFLFKKGSSFLSSLPQMEFQINNMLSVSTDVDALREFFMGGF